MRDKRKTPSLPLWSSWSSRRDRQWSDIRSKTCKDLGYMRAHDWRQGEADRGRQAEEAMMELRAGGAKVRAEVKAEFPGHSRVGLEGLFSLLQRTLAAWGLSTCPRSAGTSRVQ